MLLAGASLFALPADQAQAQQTVTINGPETVTNGGNSLTDDNVITISKGGSITTAEGNVKAVQVRNRNTITNSGTISTSGTLGIGIEARSNNTIINSGTIATSGVSASAINALLGSGGNTIFNSGTIITSGTGSSGIVVEASDSTITNKRLDHHHRGW